MNEGFSVGKSLISKCALSQPAIVSQTRGYTQPSPLPALLQQEVHQMSQSFEKLHRGQREEVDFVSPVAQRLRAREAQGAEGRPLVAGRVLGRGHVG